MEKTALQLMGWMVFFPSPKIRGSEKRTSCDVFYFQEITADICGTEPHKDFVAQRPANYCRPL